MVKMNSVSGIVFFVKDLGRSVTFYEKLGFIFKDKTSDYAKTYLNWFWIELVAQNKAEQNVFKKEIEKDNSDHTGAGLFVHISVQDVDEFYKAVLSKDLKPSSEPLDFVWGRREFIIRDPDGYKLVFFQKI